MSRRVFDARSMAWLTSLAFYVLCWTSSALTHLRQPFVNRQLVLVQTVFDSIETGLGDRTRRGVLASAITYSMICSKPSSAFGGSIEDSQPSPSSGEILRIPLQYIPGLSAYVLYYQVGGEPFGAILDTGSPFLVVPNYCNRRKWGCYTPDSSRPSGLSATYENFDNNEGEVEWRAAPFSFVNATGSMLGPQEMVFGVLSDSLMTGPGGVFFGLIRDTDDRIRPSFLGQTNVKAFDIDLRESDQKSLILYATSFLARSGSDYIPLVKDLNRKYGDPVVHYTAKASSVSANGRPIVRPFDKTPIYVIFDTGVTGMVVSRELLDQRYTAARKNREKSLWGTVEITFRTKQDKLVSLSAKKPVTTPLGKKPWPKFNNAHLVVLGLAFLDGHKLSIDIDEERLQIC